ncbi:MAG: hypothetical protein JEZ14_01930 [Marinilabiliaceae bacterium]|nr:hypothetical protein [Marinilabiliaceae bacterium]
MYSITFLVALFICNDAESKGYQLQGKDYIATIRENGTVSEIIWNQKDTVSFLSDGFVGPSFYGVWDDSLREVSLSHKEELRFEGVHSDLKFSLTYINSDDRPALKITIKNMGNTPIQPQKVGVRLGLDTYMEEYPQWHQKFFPTMMRCEKTHFWGYAMAPNGNILCLASPDKVASWSNDFTKSWGAPEYKWFGHRITSTNIDLLNALPLPQRHPQDLWQLMPKEERTWTLHFQLTGKLDNVPLILADITGANYLDIPVTTVRSGERLSFTCLGSVPRRLLVHTPKGEKVAVKVNEDGQYLFSNTAEPGVYTIECCAVNGKVSTGKVTVRKAWNWYLQQARLNALKYPARATTHCETWYGLYTLYLAQKHAPDTLLLAQTEERFRNIFPQLYDTLKLVPTKIPHRIQNTSSMIGVLTDRYQATGDIKSLEMAAGLADWIVAHAQSDDGAYRAGHTHYTSVIYPAKSMMELLEAEKELARNNPVWQKRMERHYLSVKKAVDDLALHKDNIDTEGQLTYEDGMVSCSALQLGLFALMQKKQTDIERYKLPALELLAGHRCLTQLLVPDSRMRNATLRFWESQYDVYIQPNMFNSPHGWSSWRTYATYYAYLMTGEEKWLVQTFNALGTCMQVIDFESGNLRWGFVASPYVPVVQTSQPHFGEDPDVYSGGHFHPLQYPHRRYVLGEQYVDMISNWIRANSQDNDVHEHFKCMAEIALTNAFIIEREDGTLKGYNCSATKTGHLIEVVPDEPQISNLHYNLKGKYRIKFEGTTSKGNAMGWIKQALQ